MRFLLSVLRVLVSLEWPPCGVCVCVASTDNTTGANPATTPRQVIHRKRPFSELSTGCKFAGFLSEAHLIIESVETITQPHTCPAEHIRATGRSGLGGQDLTDAMAAVSQHRREMEYLELVMLHELFDDGYAHQRDPKRPADAAAAVAKIDPRAVRQKWALASMVLPRTTLHGETLPAKLPRTGELLAAHQLGVAQAQVIAEETHTGTAQRVHEAYPDDWAEAERQIADFAATTTRTTEVRGFARDLFRLLDQDGTEPEDPGPQPSTLRLRTHPDGGGTLHARLNPADYATVATAIDALSRPAVDKPDSLTERAANALVEIAAFTLRHDKDLPTTGGRPPQVTVTVSLDQLRQRLTGATLDYGGPIDAEHARLLACDAHIIPVVLNSAGQPLDVGRAQRTATPAIRTAVQTRDRGCAWPGCHRPPPWCDTHHIVHWADGGTTNINNLIMLCHRHHDMTHHTGWHIRIRDKTPEFIPPTWIDPNQTPRRKPTRGHVLSS